MMAHLREVPHLLVPLEGHRHSVATIKEALVTLTSKYHHHHHHSSLDISGSYRGDIFLHDIVGRMCIMGVL